MNTSHTVTQNVSPSSANFHFFDFLDAKNASTSTVQAKANRGWKLFKVNHGFGAAGGTANYDHALVGPAGELLKVSERTVEAAGVALEDGVLPLNVLVLLLEGVYKTDLTMEAINRGLSSAEELGTRWNGESRRWMIRPEARANFAKWVPHDAKPTPMFSSMQTPEAQCN
jgi:hypothetical protein